MIVVPRESTEAVQFDLSQAGIDVNSGIETTVVADPNRPDNTATWTAATVVGNVTSYLLSPAAQGYYHAFARVTNITPQRPVVELGRIYRS